MLNETQRKMLQNEADRIRDVVSVCAPNEVFILPSGVSVKDVGDAITQALADSDALAVAQKRIEELEEQVDRLCGGR